MSSNEKFIQNYPSLIAFCLLSKLITYISEFKHIYEEHEKPFGMYREEFEGYGSS